MSHSRSLLQKSIAGVLSASLFLTQSLFAHASERNFWAERGAAARQMRGASGAETRMAERARQLMAGLSAPAPVRPEWMEQEVTRAFVPGTADGAQTLQRPELSGVSKVIAQVSGQGTLRSLRAPAAAAAAPVVVFLQDAHGVASAQRNISQAILNLAQAHPDLVVGMEGAAGPVDASPYRGPSEKVNRQSAELLFKADLIAGPELAAFSAPAGVRFEGLEEPALYLKNVRAVQETFARKTQLLADVQALSARAERLKASLWPEALRDLERRRAEHEAGKLSLADYVAGLPADGAAAEGLPQVALFRRVHAMEKALDFAAVGRDRAALLSRLSDRLPAPALEELLEAGISLRAGRMGQTAYYTHFNGIVRRAGVSLSDFPRFEKYIAYVTTADGVRPEAFGRELRLLEERLSRSLCVTPPQAELLAAVNDLALAAKLVDFRMTPEEWRAYESRMEAVRALPARLSALEGAAAQEPLFLADFETFYRTAEARNNVLAENLFGALGGTGKSLGGKVAVVVCGGFHTEGLTDEMVRRGAWVAVVSPQMELAELSSGKDPLAAFTRAPTPVETLFESPKPSLVTEATLARTHVTAHGAAKAGIVAGGVGQANLILLSQLRENEGEPAPAVDTPLEVEMMSHLVVDAANDNASSFWTAPGGELVTEEVRGTGAEETVSGPAAGFDGAPALSVAGGDGPSFSVGRKASGLSGRVLSWAVKGARRAAPLGAAAAFAFMASACVPVIGEHAPVLMASADQMRASLIYIPFLSTHWDIVGAFILLALYLFVNKLLMIRGLHLEIEEEMRGEIGSISEPALQELHDKLVQVEHRPVTTDDVMVLERMAEKVVNEVRMTRSSMKDLVGLSTSFRQARILALRTSRRLMEADISNETPEGFDRRAVAARKFYALTRYSRGRLWLLASAGNYRMLHDGYGRENSQNPTNPWYWFQKSLGMHSVTQTVPDTFKTHFTNGTHTGMEVSPALLRSASKDLTEIMDPAKGFFAPRTKAPAVNGIAHVWEQRKLSGFAWGFLAVAVRYGLGKMMGAPDNNLPLSLVTGFGMVALIHWAFIAVGLERDRRRNALWEEEERDLDGLLHLLPQKSPALQPEMPADAPSDGPLPSFPLEEDTTNPSIPAPAPVAPQADTIPLVAPPAPESPRRPAVFAAPLAAAPVRARRRSRSQTPGDLFFGRFGRNGKRWKYVFLAATIVGSAIGGYTYWFSWFHNEPKGNAASLQKMPETPVDPLKGRGDMDAPESAPAPAARPAHPGSPRARPARTQDKIDASPSAKTPVAAPAPQAPAATPAPSKPADAKPASEPGNRKFLDKVLKGIDVDQAPQETAPKGPTGSLQLPAAPADAFRPVHASAVSRLGIRLFTGVTGVLFVLAAPGAFASAGDVVSGNGLWAFVPAAALALAGLAFVALKGRRPGRIKTVKAGIFAATLLGALLRPAVAMAQALGWTPAQDDAVRSLEQMKRTAVESDWQVQEARRKSFLTTQKTTGLVTQMLLRPQSATVKYSAETKKDGSGPDNKLKWEFFPTWFRLVPEEWGQLFVNFAAGGTAADEVEAKKTAAAFEGLAWWVAAQEAHSRLPRLQGTIDMLTARLTALDKSWTAESLEPSRASARLAQLGARQTELMRNLSEQAGNAEGEAKVKADLDALKAVIQLEAMLAVTLDELSAARTALQTAGARLAALTGDKTWETKPESLLPAPGVDVSVLSSWLKEAGYASSDADVRVLDGKLLELERTSDVIFLSQFPTLTFSSVMKGEGPAESSADKPGTPPLTPVADMTKALILPPWSPDVFNKSNTLWGRLNYRWTSHFEAANKQAENAHDIKLLRAKRNKLLAQLKKDRDEALKTYKKTMDQDIPLNRKAVEEKRAALSALLASFPGKSATPLAVEKAKAEVDAAVAEGISLNRKALKNLQVILRVPAGLPEPDGAEVETASPPVRGLEMPFKSDISLLMGWDMFDHHALDPKKENKGLRLPGDFWSVRLSVSDLKIPNHPIKLGPFELSGNLFGQLTGPLRTDEWSAGGIGKDGKPVERGGGVNITLGAGLTLVEAPANPGKKISDKMAAATRKVSVPRAPAERPVMNTAEELVSYVASQSQDVRVAEAAAEAAAKTSPSGNAAGLALSDQFRSGNRVFKDGFDVHPDARDGEHESHVAGLSMSPTSAVGYAKAKGAVEAAQRKAAWERAKVEEKAWESLARFANALAEVDAIDAMAPDQQTLDYRKALAILEATPAADEEERALKAVQVEKVKTALKAAEERSAAFKDALRKRPLKEMESAAKEFKVEAALPKAGEKPLEPGEKPSLTPAEVKAAARDLLSRAQRVTENDLAVLPAEDGADEGHPLKRVVAATRDNEVTFLQSLVGVVDSLGLEMKNKRSEKPFADKDEVAYFRVTLNEAALSDAAFRAWSRGGDAQKAFDAARLRLQKDLDQSATVVGQAKADQKSAEAFLRFTEDLLRLAQKARDEGADNITDGDLQALRMSVSRLEVRAARTRAEHDTARLLRAQKLRRASGGFTLVELMGVLSLIGLASIGVVSWLSHKPLSPLLLPALIAAAVLAAAVGVVHAVQSVKRGRLVRAAVVALSLSQAASSVGAERAAAAAVRRQVVLSQAAKPVRLKDFGDDLRVLKFMQSARPVAAAREGNVDPRLQAILAAAPELPAADFVTSRGRPAVVPAVDVSDPDSDGVAAFLAQRMRELRDVPLVVLPLVTHRESLSASDVAAIKDRIKANLLSGPGEWQETEVDQLFRRLSFGHRRLVITAKDMRAAGQDWIDPAEVMDSRLLRTVIRDRSARFLGMPARKLSVSMFTGNADGYTLVAGLDGFQLLQILSVHMVKDVTGALHTALEAFERAGQSA